LAIAAAPATPHEGHASCKAFGETVLGNAQSERPWGRIVSNGARLGLTSALTDEAHTIEGPARLGRTREQCDEWY
jgi:hypothetical protein